MVFKIINKYDSESELCLRLIKFYNIVDDWGLTDTQINILVYLIRFGWSNKTKAIIIDRLKISDNSLTTNISYMRRGRVGDRKIKKLLLTSSKNRNITTLGKELSDIKKFVESTEENKSLYIRFDPVK